VRQQVPREGQRIRHTDAISPSALAAGVFALLAGALIYLADRRPDSTIAFHSLSDALGISGNHARLFGSWGQNLPSFLHVLAFSLITGGIAQKNRTTQAGICLFWFLVNLIFELGQKYPDTALSLTGSLDGIPILKKTGSFFIQGTFDPLDILAFAAGALTAYALFLVMDKRSDRL
jgi:hypothetical protein